MKKLNRDDINWLRENLDTMRSDEERMDENGYDDVMTSVGYVCLWVDGEVSAYGETIGVFDEDGDFTFEDGSAVEGGEE